MTLRCAGCGVVGELRKTSSYLNWDLYLCGRCGLMFWHPLEFQERQYSEDAHYLRHSMGELLMPYHHDALDVVLKRTRDTSGGLLLLDIGCGNGSFLRLVQRNSDRFGCFGLDLNPHAVEYAQGTFGRNVLRANIFEDNDVTARRKFDVITFLEVFEHQTDPVGFLGRVMSLLKPGGIVVGSVPDYRRHLPLGVREAFDYPPHHFTWWTLETLTGMLGRNGFEDVELELSSPWDLVGFSIELESAVLGGLKKRIKKRAIEKVASGGGVPRVAAGALRSPFARVVRASAFMPLALPLYLKYRLIEGGRGRFIMFSGRKQVRDAGDYSSG